MEKVPALVAQGVLQRGEAEFLRRGGVEKPFDPRRVERLRAPIPREARLAEASPGTEVRVADRNHAAGDHRTATEHLDSIRSRTCARDRGPETPRRPAEAHRFRFGCLSGGIGNGEFGGGLGIRDGEDAQRSARNRLAGGGPDGNAGSLAARLGSVGRRARSNGGQEKKRARQDGAAPSRRSHSALTFSLQTSTGTHCHSREDVSSTTAWSTMSRRSSERIRSLEAIGNPRAPRTRGSPGWAHCEDSRSRAPLTSRGSALAGSIANTSATRKRERVRRSLLFPAQTPLPRSASRDPRAP